MKIKSLKVTNDGYVHCKSRFYTAAAMLNSSKKFEFLSGINMLKGEIDSDVWAISYLLSMYKHKRENFTIFEQPEVILNDTVMTLEDLSLYSCYMDRTYPLFSTDDTIRTMVSRELEKSGKPYSIEQVRDMFYLDHQRFERPLRGVGNEIFRSMAAVGYAGGKELFCFPWLSRKRFDSYHRNITGLLEILENLDKMVIVPVGIYE